MPREERWYERSSWTVFFGFGILLVAYGTYKFLLPTLQPDHWAWLTADPDVVRYIAGHFRWSGLLVAGLGLFCVAIAVTAFRAGEEWAWYVLWYFPVLFLVGSFVTWAAPFLLLFFVLSAMVLLLSRRRFVDRVKHPQR